MKAILTQIAAHSTLTRAEAERAMDLVLSGSVSREQLAGFLLGLRSRGETVEELTGFTHVMRAHAVPVAVSDPNALDLVGTGGDGHGTFNITTAAAFVCAGAGATVAKHNNRSASSRCGSAEVLDALGVKTSLGASGVEYCIEETGIGFIYAPLFHPAMKHVMPVRRALGVRTCFNILGPMCNPARVAHQMVGAFDLKLARMMAEILVTLGAKRIITVHADDGLDEVSVSGRTTLFIQEEEGEGIRESVINPSDFGLAVSPLGSIQGGEADLNAAMVQSVLAGEPGPPRDIVVLNAAFALYAGRIASNIEDGIRMAMDSIDSGKAARRLKDLIAVSHAAPEDQL